MWVDWVYDNIPEILKAGLKQLPGCLLEPSTDSSDQTLKKRLKLKKRKRR
jgi:hypothetical protein